MPTSPGYKTVLVTPMIGFLGQSEVSGTVPTSNGLIEVAWTLSGASVAITITVPTGMTVTLQLPAGAAVVGSNGRLELPCGKTEMSVDTKV